MVRMMLGGIPNERPAVLSSDTIEGRKLLGGIGPLPAPLHRIMDRAYEDNETLQLALDFGFIPVVPPRPAASRALAVRQGYVPSTQRNRAPVPQAERLSAHLLALRQTRLGLPCLPPLRPYRRSPQMPN